MNGRLRHFLVLHRGLGSNDESASPEERAERLLYFFPPVAPLDASLALMESMEAFMAFAALASGSPVAPQPISVTLDAQAYLLVPAPSADVWLCAEVEFEPMAPVEESMTSRLLSVWSTTRAPQGGPDPAVALSNLACAIRQLLAQTQLCLGDISKVARCREAALVAQALKAARQGQAPVCDVAAVRSSSPLEAMKKGLRRLVPVFLEGVEFTRLRFYDLDYVMKLDLDSVTFLSVQGVVEAFCQRVPTLRRNSVMLMHRGCIAWSSFAFDEARTLARYLHRAESSGLGVVGDSGSGLLLVGMLLSTVGDTGGQRVSRLQAPVMYFGDALEPARLVAFRQRGVTVVFAVEASEDDTEDSLARLLANVDKLLAVELALLAKVIEAKAGGAPTPAELPAHLVRNGVDASLQVSAALAPREPAPAMARFLGPGALALALDGAVVRAVDAALELMRGVACGALALCVVSQGEPVWVCARRADHRLVLAVVPGPKNGTRSLLGSVADVQVEFERVLEGRLHGVFV